MRMKKLLAALAVLAPVLAGYGGTAAAQPRSAQSDCARELSRYGLTPAGWGNFRQLSNGWQVDLSARDNRGRTDGGTCMVFTSGQIRLYGFDNLGNSWGGGGGSGGGMTFNCASKDGRYKECQTPVNGRVELNQRWSDARCQEGYSWGVKGDRVWVNHGCRAEFKVTPRGGGGGSGSQIDCRSTSGRYVECRMPNNAYGRLVRDYSGQCRLGQSWGSDRGRVWVRANCQGRFEATRYPPDGSLGGGGFQPGPSSNDLDRADSACRQEAGRMGYKVEAINPGASAGHTLTLSMSLRRNHQTTGGSCSYDKRSGRVQVRVEPIPF